MTAAVEAQEWDMGMTLATKHDFEMQRLATEHDFKLQRLATKQDLEILKLDMESQFALLDHKLKMLELRLTAKLGLAMVVGFGLMVAALRL